MNKLRVKCIHCGKEWEKDADFPWGPDDCSSSLCRACFVQVATPLIRKKQRLEGNFDCFGKGDAYCDQAACKYRQWCLPTEASEQREEYMDDAQDDSHSLHQSHECREMPLS